MKYGKFLPAILSTIILGATVSPGAEEPAADASAQKAPATAIRVERSVGIDASADHVYAMVRDFETVEQWSGGIVVSSRTSPAEGGNVRVLRLNNGSTQDVEIVETDDSLRTVTVRFLEGPLRDSITTATIRVADRGYRKAELVWDVESENRAGSAPDRQEARVTGLVDTFLNGIRAIHESAAPTA